MSRSPFSAYALEFVVRPNATGGVPLRMANRVRRRYLTRTGDFDGDGIVNESDPTPLGATP